MWGHLKQIVKDSYYLYFFFFYKKKTNFYIIKFVIKKKKKKKKAKIGFSLDQDRTTILTHKAKNMPRKFFIKF
jgi:hypothetical protein